MLSTLSIVGPPGRFAPADGARRDSLLLDDSAKANPLSARAHGAVEALVDEAGADLEALVAISTPSGDVQGAEGAVALCEGRLPQSTTVERVPCSSPAHADDLLARVEGRGHGRLLLLGHLDTVVSHAEHIPLQRDGDAWRGSGAVDMKGGVALALALSRWLATRRELFAELALLLVLDEEWRLDPFAHLDRFAGFDACLCFEAGERAGGGAEGVIVQRKAAGTLSVTALGRAAHAGSDPDAGANALLALTDAARVAASLHDPGGADALSVVPSRIRSGGAINVVPAEGELMIDMRARSSAAFARVIDSLPGVSHGARIDAELIRSWPGMDSREATASLLEAAGTQLGRPIVGAARGGASDASHLAGVIPLTIDGLGPRGGHAHSPEEFVYAPSLRERLEVAIALCEVLPGTLAERSG
jgi:glutamate carboxypeptidase